ncbi:hypothetical protein O6H91_04G046600 [Diphasiastrum complanatum]|uniref:Uncharacterized protein n=1 Tax=Diphasiastrum complanatum TaxID=34168 RepID=A0ACC2DWF6_DIPCM|nr:hypothetical protein O6H91_04G046600 [Diphasiastrum complanatum]
MSSGSGSTGPSAVYGGATTEISSSTPISQILHPQPGSSYAGVTTNSKIVGRSPIVGNQMHSLEWQQLAAQQRESYLQTQQQMIHGQQGADAGVGNSTVKRSTVPNQGGVAFAAIVPVLMHSLPSENRHKLNAVFQKWKKGEVCKEDLVRCLKLVAGDEMLLRAVRFVQHKQQQHQQQKNQLELQNAQQQTQVKQPREKQSVLDSLDAEEEADTDTSSESDSQSNQLMSHIQEQMSHLNPKQQIHLQLPVGNLSDISSSTNLSTKVKPGEQLLECGPLHLNPMPASLQQVKHEVDRSLASMQLTFQQQHKQHQLSARESQGPAGIHPQNSVAGKLSSQPRPQVLFQEQQSAEAQEKAFLQQSHLFQVSKYEKQKHRREQKNCEDEERLRKIQESDRLKKALNARTQQGVGQHDQHQQSQSQTVPQRVNVSKSERLTAPVMPSPATLSVKQDFTEQQIGQIQTLQSLQSLSHGEDLSEKKASETADGRSQFEVEQSSPNLSRTAAANVPAVPSSMSLRTTAVSVGVTVSTVMPLLQGSSGELHPQSMMPGSLIQQVQASQLKATQKKSIAIQKKPADAAPIGQPPSKKVKVDGGDPTQSIDQLNDVTIVSGVNLREEEEQLLAGPKEESRATEAMRKFIQEEENRLFLEKASLHAKVSSIATKHGIRNINDDVERCLSMSVEERLWSILCKLGKISKQQSDMEQEKHMIIRTSDVRTKVIMIRRKAKEEFDRKQAEEAERLRKLNEEKQALADVGKESATKTQKEQQQEEDKRRTAANLVARAAVGVDDMLMKWQMMAEQGKQKRNGNSGGAADSTAGTKLQDRSIGIAGPASNALKSNSMSSRLERACGRITIQDMIAVLELEPQMAKSAFLYKLYEREPKHTSEEAINL